MLVMHKSLYLGIQYTSADASLQPLTICSIWTGHTRRLQTVSSGKWKNESFYLFIILGSVFCTSKGSFIIKLFAPFMLTSSHYVHRLCGLIPHGMFVSVLAYFVTVCLFFFSYKKKFSKRGNKWTVYPVKVTKAYSYIEKLMVAAVNKDCTGQKHIYHPIKRQAGDPRNIASTIASIEPPPTAELVTQRKSRLAKWRKNLN